MRKRYIRYSDQAIREAVAKSRSIAEVLRRLGIEKLSGGMHSHISRRIKRLGLSTSHMTGQAWLRGGISKNRLKPEDVFVYDRRRGWREHTPILRRILIETGMKYECTRCGQGDMWQGQPITLDIDHINCDFMDNDRANLRFLCPNCHSQR